MTTPGQPGEDTALRPLTIDLDDLAFALTWHDDYQGSSHWLNLDTGEVVFVADPGDLDSMAEDPRDDERFVRIDAIDSWQSFRIREDFVEQLGDAALARRLGRALAQRKPFRHFKDELARHPAQREAWFAFEHTALEQLARQWCAACGVAPRAAWRRAGRAGASAPHPMGNREATTAMEHRQLDIFEDARDVALRNDLAGAVERCDTAAARAATTALRSEFGDDPVLPPAKRLIAHIETQQGAPARFDAAQVLAWRAELEREIEGAAHALLGPQAARAWMAAQWRWLADRARAVSWHVGEGDAHAAPLYLRAGDWAAAAEAAMAVESWRRIPQPLLWTVQAHWRLGRMDGPNGAWPLLAEALWLAPTCAAALIPQLADPRLDKLARGFEGDFDPTADGWAWLPAWALVDQPGLLATLAPADAPADCAPADGYGLVAALLRLERQGRHHEIVAHRRRLKALSETLFAVYMRTR